MPKTGSNIFTEDSNTDQVVGVLYAEKLPDGYNEILVNSPFGYVVSPLHTPDDTDKKPHYHILLRDMHGHRLQYSQVHALMDSLNPEPAPMLCLVGGHRAVIDYCRYMVHFQHPEKQQFDMRDPVFYDLDTDDNGFCKDTHLASVYDDKYGVCFGGGLDFWKLIHVTAREEAGIRREKLLLQLKSVSAYVYENRLENFADLAYWCEQNGYLECCIAYRDYLYKILSSIASSSLYTFNEKNKSATYKDFSRASYVDICEHIQECANTSIPILAPYLHWFISMYGDFIKSPAFKNPTKVRQKLFYVLDINTLEPRKKFKNSFDDWSAKNLC